MDHIKSQLDNLADLNDEQITALEASIVSQFDEFADADRSVETVDAMSELADMLDSVRGEVVRREAQAEELEARAAEAANRVHGAPEEDEAPEAEDTEVPVEDEETDEEDIPVTASADETAEVASESEIPVEISEAEASVEEVEAEESVSESAPEAEASVEAVETPEEASVEEVAEVEDAEAEASVEESVEEPVAESEASVEEVAEVEAQTEAEASIEETPIEHVAQEEAQTVTASAEETFEAPADRRVDLQVTEAPVAIVAGADIPGYAAGQNLTDRMDVAKAFNEKLSRLRHANGGDGEQTVVASFRTEYDEAHSLIGGTAEANGAKIAAAREELAAIVASGGYGTPSPQRYDIFGFGTDARPVKDSLPKFQADRGSISYIEPPQLADYADAVGVWTPAMDIASAANGGSGADVTKNLLVVKGATTRTAEIDAITLQLQIGNLLGRAYPELVDRHNELALIQHARLAEKTLLSKISAGSTAVTAASRVGVARDFLVTVRQAATQYRSRHRLSLDTPLQAVIPNWVYEALASDMTLQMPGDDKMGVAKAEIDGYLRASNVSFTPSYDLNEFGTQSAGALNSWGTTFDWFLFSEGTWLFLDGGSLDLGIVRDSALVGTNDYRMFVETFEGVAKIGIESLKITQTFKVSGAASALEDIHA